MVHAFKHISPRMEIAVRLAKTFYRKKGIWPTVMDLSDPDIDFYISLPEYTLKVYSNGTMQTFHVSREKGKNQRNLFPGGNRIPYPEDFKGFEVYIWRWLCTHSGEEL